MASSYRSFRELARNEVEGKGYRIKFHPRDERVLIIAAHGEQIEPTTSLIGEAIAGGRSIREKLAMLRGGNFAKG